MRAAIAPLPRLENRPLALAIAFVLAGLIHALFLSSLAPLYEHHKEITTQAPVVELDVGLLKRVPVQVENSEILKEVLETDKKPESASTPEPTVQQPTKPAARKAAAAAAKAPPPQQASGRKTSPIKTDAENTPAAQVEKTIGREKAASRAPADASPVPDAGASNPKPQYPPLARKRGQEGTVKVLCRVNANGNVASVSLAQGSGFRLLDEAALKTARLWKFRPAQKDNANVAGETTVTIEFRLMDN